MAGKIQRDNYPNLNISSKWLGIIDYKTLIIFLLILFFTWNVLGLFVTNQIYKIYVLVIVTIPFLGILYANKSSENISNILYTVVKYIFSPKYYVYKIESNKPWLK